MTYRRSYTVMERGIQDNYSRADTGKKSAQGIHFILSDTVRRAKDINGILEKKRIGGIDTAFFGTCHRMPSDEIDTIRKTLGRFFCDNTLGRAHIRYDCPGFDKTGDSFDMFENHIYGSAKKNEVFSFYSILEFIIRKT